MASPWPMQTNVFSKVLGTEVALSKYLLHVETNYGFPEFEWHSKGN